jgi:hypothetical protein
MSESKNNRCFVLLPSGEPHYARLFDDLFAIAITNAGLVPHSIEQTPAPPLNLLVGEIAKADAIFVDLSQSDASIWFVIGCALALKKPLCVVSSTLDFNLPFNIDALDIIPYPEFPFPSDYIDLEENITESLLAALPKIEAQPAQPASLTQPSLQIQPPIPTVSTVAPSSPAADLTLHEILALTIIDRGSERGLSPRELGLEMKESEAAHLTSHAMSSLKRKKLIENRPVQITRGNESYVSENLFVTYTGEKWLLRNGKRRHLAQPASDPRELFLSSR